MFWKALVSKSGWLDPAIVERAWHAGTLANDDKLLSTIAGRNDLPETVEQAVIKHKRAQIRSARFARKGWATAELLEAITNERATSALLVCAEQDRREEVQQSLLLRAKTKNSKSLTEALAINPALSADVAGQVWARIGVNYPETWRLPGHLRVIGAHIALRTDAHASLGKHLLNPAFGREMLTSNYLDAAGAQNVVAIFVTGLARFRTPTAVHNAQLLIQNTALPKDGRDALELAIKDLEMAGVFDQGDVAAIGRMARGLVSRVTPHVGGGLAAVRAVTSTDSAELAVLAKTAVATQDRKLAQQLSYNEYLDHAGALDVVRVIQPWSEQAAKLLNKVGVENPDLFATILVEHPYWINHGGLSGAQKQRCLEKLLAELTCSATEAGNLRRAWKVLISGISLTIDQILDAPWWVLEFVDDDVRETVGTWLTATIGSKVSGWNLLGLLDLGDVTTRELAGAVVSLV